MEAERREGEEVERGGGREKGEEEEGVGEGEERGPEKILIFCTITKSKESLAILRPTQNMS